MTMENELRTYAGCARLCADLIGIKPTASIKGFVCDCLEAAARYGYPPPEELIELARQALKVVPLSKRSSAKSPSYWRAIEYEAFNQEIGATALARKLGVARKTIHEWRRDPEWQSAVERTRQCWGERLRDPEGWRKRLERVAKSVT
jgi:hypothetical protein